MYADAFSQSTLFADCCYDRGWGLLAEAKILHVFARQCKYQSADLDYDDSLQYKD